jgi:hypothetical protein
MRDPREPRFYSEFMAQLYGTYKNRLQNESTEEIEIEKTYNRIVNSYNHAKPGPGRHDIFHLVKLFATEMKRRGYILNDKRL